ncbi:MAG: ATP-binding cassette domain-containing protein, partial [Acidimicrobiia bacterium]|nr:ATP-binding cassette domain-containing protein [Acidimicrobiia bacterium]
MTATSTNGSAAAPAGRLLTVEHLVKTFALRGQLFSGSTGTVQAVSDVSFHVDRNETLSLVGESGCGKSTTARCVLRILEPDSGSIVFDGVDVTALPAKELRRARRRFQMVFQDPQASLNPRMTVAELLAEPLQVHGILRGSERSRVAE